ncbi:hypothetical protein CJ030_MR5G023968 [Morella rubra]|uniref:Uncharacterized protein n=1 Tax=Morella rubra TaxID=262757 RepID=A0A6A1VKP8_9ROSI|nr:hypothetical protein CJ030_MR5G023968 [Morella rubra]
MGKVKDRYWEIGWVRAWEMSRVRALGEGRGVRSMRIIDSDSETERAILSDMYDFEEGDEGQPELYPLGNDVDYELEEEFSEDSVSEGADKGKGKNGTPQNGETRTSQTARISESAGAGTSQSAGVGPSEPMLAKGEGRKRLSRSPRKKSSAQNNREAEQPNAVTAGCSQLPTLPRRSPRKKSSTNHISEPLNDNQHMEDVILDAVI